MYELTFPASGTQDLSLDLFERRRKDGLEQIIGNFPERLLRRPTVQFLGGTVPIPEYALHIPNQDAVMREVQQVRLLAGGCWGLFRGHRECPAISSTGGSGSG